MSQKSKTILVLGTHGQKNFGDDLLLESFLLGLSQNTRFNLNFIINSYDPSEVLKKYEDRYSVQSFHTTRDLYKLPLFVYQADIVLFAGGSILKELNQSTGRYRSSSLLMVFGVVFVAWVLQKKIVLSHIGASNLVHKFPRFIAGLVLRMINRVSFRDQDSFELCCSINRGIIPVSTVVPDIVFAFPKLVAKHIGSTKKEENGITYFGLNLNAAIKNADRWNSFVSEIENIFIELNKNINLEVICIPFQDSFEKLNDLRVLKDFGEKMRQNCIPVTIKDVPGSYEEMCDILNSIDVFVVERFHGIVLSLLNHTKFFALSYDTKIDSLIKAVGVKNLSVSINEELDVRKVKQCILELTKSKLLIDMSKIDDMTDDAYESIIQLSRYVESI